MSNTKLCPACEQILDKSSFRFRNPNSTILQSYCRECERKRWREWREKNRDEQVARTFAYWQSNKDKILAQKHEAYWANPQQARINSRRSKQSKRTKNSYLVTSKEIELLSKKSCFACGAKEKISIDHIIPISRGGNHSIGNIMPLCGSCNSSKHDKTFMEWRIWKMRKNA